MRSTPTARCGAAAAREGHPRLAQEVCRRRAGCRERRARPGAVDGLRVCLFRLAVQREPAPAGFEPGLDRLGLRRVGIGAGYIGDQ